MKGAAWSCPGTSSSSRPHASFPQSTACTVHTRLCKDEVRPHLKSRFINQRTRPNYEVYSLYSLKEQIFQEAV